MYLFESPCNSSIFKSPGRLKVERELEPILHVFPSAIQRNDNWNETEAADSQSDSQNNSGMYLCKGSVCVWSNNLQLSEVLYSDWFR